MTEKRLDYADGRKKSEEGGFVGSGGRKEGSV